MTVPTEPLRKDHSRVDQPPRGHSMMTKLRHLSLSEAMALIEATIFVALAAPIIRLLPFRTIAAAASRGSPGSPGRQRDVAAVAAVIERVAWAVDRTAKRLPTRSLCFERGLAAHAMLRRRGVDSTLVYGVSPGTSAEGLNAHVWVHVDGVEVTGGGEAPAFAPLVSFPAGRTKTSLRARPAAPELQDPPA